MGCADKSYIMPPIPRSPSAFTPPASATVAHISASASENQASDLAVTLKAIGTKIGDRDNDKATGKIQRYVGEHFEATRPEVPWWNLPGRIQRHRHERTHDQAVLVLSMGSASGATDGLYVGRRGLLFGSESSNFFELTDHVPDRALKHAAGSDGGKDYLSRLDGALAKLANKIDAGDKPPIVEASFKPYVV